MARAGPIGCFDIIGLSHAMITNPENGHLEQNAALLVEFAMKYNRSFLNGWTTNVINYNSLQTESGPKRVVQ